MIDEGVKDDGGEIEESLPAFAFMWEPAPEWCTIQKGPVG
jgi:hypothetical protein